MTKGQIISYRVNVQRHPRKSQQRLISVVYSKQKQMRKNQIFDISIEILVRHMRDRFYKLII